MPKRSPVCFLHTKSTNPQTKLGAYMLYATGLATTYLASPFTPPLSLPSSFLLFLACLLYYSTFSSQ